MSLLPVADACSVPCTGDPSPDQLAMIRTRKPEAPVIEVKCNDGFVHRLWCTFGEQQIDIDPFSASGQEFVKESLKALGTHGAKLVRLDAFGYATKKADTRCVPRIRNPACYRWPA